MATHKYEKKKSKTKAAGIPAVSEHLRNNIILTLLVIYTFGLFAKVMNYQFVNWDDNSYITGNLLIRNFSWAGFKDIFTTPVIGMYNPLPFVAYAFLYKSYGLDAGPYHVLNVFLHL